jgi:hypothetical protein
VSEACGFLLELLLKRRNALAGFQRCGAGHGADQGFLADQGLLFGGVVRGMVQQVARMQANAGIRGLCSDRLGTGFGCATAWNFQKKEAFFLKGFCSVSGISI